MNETKAPPLELIVRDFISERSLGRLYKDPLGDSPIVQLCRRGVPADLLLTRYWSAVRVAAHV